jgi:hypothetical protein
MSTFKNASIVEQVVWTMKLADYPRGQNRSRINDLINGVPPYSPEEVRQNNIATNVNFLESTKMAQDARRQFSNAFMKPGNFFGVTVDSGPKHKRREWGVTITNQINRCMKNSLCYFEALRSTFASVVLHGIGPVVWEDRESWLPDPVGVEDVMVPSNTLLTFKNLPFFAIYRQYTAEQLWRMTHGPKVDPAWNMDVVEQALKWADQETSKLSGSAWPEVWSPEKMSERIKSDGGLYASDSVPTIDCWDFYFWNDENDEAGWNRRIILDAWGSPGIGGALEMPDKNKIGGRNQFLYNPKDRVYASKINEIVHFQFGDLSAVAPFRYHSVRSLGFLLYAVCHLQNRMRCKFNDAVFEHLLQYFRVHNAEDAERALKINLVDRRIIDDSVEFIGQKDRWQVNQALVESGIAHNQQSMGTAAQSYAQQYATGVEREKTATQVMQEVNSTTALVSAALQQAYEYQKFQYIEIARRFCIKNSKDADVRKFRVNVLKQGIPEGVLDSSMWNIEPERVMGAGNKMMEMAVADKLMAVRTLLDPEAQKVVDRIYILSNSDDPALTEQLVPEQKQVSDSMHDAQLAAAALLMGLPVAIKKGHNHIEYVEVLLADMGLVIQKIEQRGGMATPEEIAGLQNMAQHVAQHVQIIEQDKNEKQRVKQYGDALGQAMNMVKAYAQRLQEQAQKAAEAQAQGNGDMDPKDVAKVKGMQLQAEAKAANTRESHAQRTAQRQAQFSLDIQRQQQEHELKMREQAQELQMDMAKQAAELEAEIARKAVEAAGQQTQKTE